MTGIIDQTVKAGCDACSACTETTGALALPFGEFPFVVLAIILLVLLLVKKNTMKTLFWSLGLTFAIALSTQVGQKISLAKESVDINTEVTIGATSGSEAEQDVFESINGNEEFEPFNDDEFVPLEEADEFSALDETNVASNTNGISPETRGLIRTLIALLATLLAGLFFHYKGLHKFKPVFLLSSIVYLGFYSGACPCMISSFQNFVLLLLGESVKWTTLVWFLGLLPLTYFFGRIWCGWICHLGAIQEFLYYRNKKNKLNSPGLQKAFKIIRLLAFITLLIQLVITRNNLYIRIDPFKVIFNLFSTNITGYILTSILLISSLFIYRPFCKSFCPMGLMLGWIEKIPGASKLHITNSCKSCKQCAKSCDYNAISHQTKGFAIDDEECIRCGACIDTCKYGSIRTTLFKKKDS